MNQGHFDKSTRITVAVLSVVNIDLQVCKDSGTKRHTCNESAFRTLTYVGSESSEKTGLFGVYAYYRSGENRRISAVINRSAYRPDAVPDICRTQASWRQPLFY